MLCTDELFHPIILFMLVSHPCPVWLLSGVAFMSGSCVAASLCFVSIRTSILNTNREVSYRRQRMGG
jgi:hypothetical protein